MWPLGDSDSRAAGHQAAVIDVGSNSVRLVIYRVDGRALWTIYNEKVVAGLGKDLTATRRLSPEGVEAAIGALRRFRAALDGWKADEVTACATAAVREAADGKAFLKRVMDETGLQVRVLSGEEEARYAGLGVICGQPDAEGVVGDLGGSSLELVRLNGFTNIEGATLPLGPFALGAPKPLNLDRTKRLVDDHLGPLAKRYASPEFHAVGGAWRNLALLHMQLADYPLHVAHQYEISRTDGLELARFVQRQSRGSLEGIEGLSKKRFDTLPYAAVVLERLIERLGVEKVVISAYGVREGLLLEAMPPEVRQLSPLIEGCEALAAHRGIAPGLGQALEAWVGPLFEKLPPLFGDRDGVLLAAACRLADLGAFLHPDHRADLAFEQVLRAPLAGMNHAERAFLANVAFARHSASPQPPDATAVGRVLTPERRQRARALGSAIRLGCDLSARNPRLLEKSAVTIRGERLSLTALAGWEDMLLGEQTARRAQALAQALKLKLEMG
ncbi:MAG: Ppx/GppA family phosphatase [Phenylobacterium sp.]|uniref:Ppx/GppA phosphatase family protein n=1 Tax=Phenylobacterium sp. TaxID=1871053 RepID=UPI0012074717|nr:Ppx/GppA phosphatase family protein [Phenylobacterium sp.]TAJ74346.1 MAG: Ppx/GppA family phosphatase [Phenylobacterium sp.]